MCQQLGCSACMHACSLLSQTGGVQPVGKPSHQKSGCSSCAGWQARRLAACPAARMHLRGAWPNTSRPARPPTAASAGSVPSPRCSGAGRLLHHRPAGVGGAWSVTKDLENALCPPMACVDRKSRFKSPPMAFWSSWRPWTPFEKGYQLTREPINAHMCGFIMGPTLWCAAGGDDEGCTWKCPVGAS